MNRRDFISSSTLAVLAPKGFFCIEGSDGCIIEDRIITKFSLSLSFDCSRPEKEQVQFVLKDRDDIPVIKCTAKNFKEESEKCRMQTIARFKKCNPNIKHAYCYRLALVDEYHDIAYYNFIVTTEELIK